MSILGEATAAEIAADQQDITKDLDEAAPDLEQGAASGYGMPRIDFGFLKAPTGDGSIEDYQEHVLNPDHSKGIAQMLRGFTGLAGNLNLAILDITFGAFHYLKENKKTSLQKNEQEQKSYDTPIINVK